VALEGPLTVLYGPNAAGKTNFVEAVFVLATSRSHRTASDAELILWGGDFSRLRAEVVRGAQATILEIIIKREIELGGRARKQVKINGLTQRAKDLVGYAPALLFSPEDIRLVDGPPVTRRRYLDFALCQVDRQYLIHLQSFQRVLVQRNALLHQSLENPTLRDQLDFWDEELVGHGSYLVAQREKAVRELNRHLALFNHQLSDKSEELVLIYHSSIGLDEDGALEEQFRRRLAAVRQKEIWQGITLVGPHRDDLEFRLDGRELASFGSRGQRRTSVLALRMAEMKLMETMGGEKPILLFDDVTSDLDPSRRMRLREMMAQADQTILTTSDLGTLDPGLVAEADVLMVAGGLISPARV